MDVVEEWYRSATTTHGLDEIVKMDLQSNLNIKIVSMSLNLKKREFGDFINNNINL